MLNDFFFFPSLKQYMAANTAMQGAYVPQYAHMQTSTVPVEVCSLARSPMLGSIKTT